ncbi:MAG: hypothetical protein JSS00_02995, partial [Proteobacteria bacterium]|nr:hypothetical protein [Pseudomonadota bacterium]
MSNNPTEQATPSRESRLREAINAAVLQHTYVNYDRPSTIAESPALSDHILAAVLPLLNEGVEDVRQDRDSSASLFANWVKDPQDNGDYMLSLSPEETRKFFEEVNRLIVGFRERLKNDFEAQLSTAQINLRSKERELAEALRERDEARAAIEIGQENCDSVYNNLKRERDLAKVDASLDREKAGKPRTQRAEEQAHADGLAQQWEMARTE